MAIVQMVGFWATKHFFESASEWVCRTIHSEKNSGGMWKKFEAYGHVASWKNQTFRM